MYVRLRIANNAFSTPSWRAPYRFIIVVIGQNVRFFPLNDHAFDRSNRPIPEHCLYCKAWKWSCSPNQNVGHVWVIPCLPLEASRMQYRRAVIQNSTCMQAETLARHTVYPSTLGTTQMRLTYNVNNIKWNEISKNTSFCWYDVSSPPWYKCVNVVIPMSGPLYISVFCKCLLPCNMANFRLLKFVQLFVAALARCDSADGIEAKPWTNVP